MSNPWHAYTYSLSRKRPGAPASNSSPAQAIGKLKIRSHAVRGSRSTLGLQAMFQLCGAWGSGSSPQLLRQSRLCPFTHRLWDSLSIEAELQRVESGVTYKRVAQVVTEMGL